MSIYKRKDSKHYWVKLPPIRGETSVLQISTGTPDKRQAKEFYDKLEAQRWEQDKLGTRPVFTWEQAADTWLSETTYRKSRNGDMAMIRWLHPYLGGKVLQDIDRALIDRIKAARLNEASASTANRYLGLIRTILRCARDEWEMVENIPKIKLFRESSGRVRSLTFDEFRRLYEELPEHLAEMALFSVATGLRQSNVKFLRWSSVSLENRHAWVEGNEHKNGAAHGVPLNDTAVAVLRRMRGKHSEFVFVYHGQPVIQVSTKAWREALKRAGVEDFRWHDLRHTWATWQRQSGTPTWELQRLGGWKTQAMVERYAHLAPDSLQNAASRIDNHLSSYDLATVKE